MRYIACLNSVVVNAPTNKAERHEIWVHRWPVRRIDEATPGVWTIVYAQPSALTIALWQAEQDIKMQRVLQETARELENIRATKRPAAAVTLICMDGTSYECELPLTTTAGAVRAAVSVLTGTDKHDQELYITTSFGQDEEATSICILALEDDESAVDLATSTTVSVLINTRGGHDARFKSQLHFGSADCNGNAYLRRPYKPNAEHGPACPWRCLRGKSQLCNCAVLQTWLYDAETRAVS